MKPGHRVQRSTVAVCLIASSVSAFGCREPRADAPSGVLTVDTLAISPNGGDTVDFTGFAGPAVSENGFTVVSGIQAKGGQLMALYDSAGGLVKLFGRRGNGPGELPDGGNARFGPGDSLVIATAAGYKVYTPAPELRFVRTFMVPRHDGTPGYRGPESSPVRRATSATVIHPRIITGQLYTGQLRLPPFEVNWDGEVVRSYGKAFFTENPERDHRGTAPAGDTLLWAAHIQEYVIELRNTDSVIRRIVRNTDWFPPDTTNRVYGERPGPRITSIWEDHGVLWVVILRATDAWRPSNAAASIRNAKGLPTGITADMPQNRYESVVEALDAQSGQLLASRTFMPSVSKTRPGIVHQKFQDSTGGYSLRLLRLRLQR